MELDEIELHDALITSTTIDYEKKSVVVGVQYYKNPGEQVRSPANILFEDVSGLSQIADLDSISRNTFAGHVNYWVPSLDGGTTYIYLVDGCVAIKSNVVRIESG